MPDNAGVELSVALCLTAAAVLVTSLGTDSVNAATVPEKDQSRQATTALTSSQAAALAGQKEYRRRGGRCMNSRVYAPAAREARVPADIGTTPVITPRLRERFGKLLCYALNGQTLWAADDQALHKVDAERGELIESYDAADGMPDRAIQHIAVTETDVWLATLGGLARLSLQTNRIEPVPGVRFSIGRVAVGAAGAAWVVSDTGCYQLEPTDGTWCKLPDFPGQARLASRVEAGFWWLRWRNGEVRLIDAAFATADGLYVLCDRRLSRYDATRGQWQSIHEQVWDVASQRSNVWALCTDGVLRYSAADDGTEKHVYGRGPAVGRPVCMAVTPDAFYLGSHGQYDAEARTFGGFRGGGISRLDLASGQWSVTDAVDGAAIHFVDDLVADGDGVWATAMLYDRPIHSGAHPGMAHVKRWRPHPAGIGLVHYRDGAWTMLSRHGLKTEQRWIGPHGIGVHSDSVGPQHAEQLCRAGDRIWTAYRMVPEQWYGGYYVSAGCAAVRRDAGWESVFDVRTDQIGLSGEHPTLLGLSRSHGSVWLAEGHLRILGLEQIADRCWVIAHGGVFVYSAETDRFEPVVEAHDRLYFRTTAAVACEDAVWFGSDAGTVSRLDRATGLLELVGIVPDRQIVAMASRDGLVLVKTALGTAALPASLRAGRRLPETEALQFDGREWSPGTADIQPEQTSYTAGFVGPHRDQGKHQVNYLCRDGKRIAFLKGVFRPKVMCEDRWGNMLWLASYTGILSVPLPSLSDAPKAAE